MVKAEEVRAPNYSLHRADAIAWLKARRANSLHAVVAHPPYGLLEYRSDNLDKMRNGKGGVWRIPPAFDGAKRLPLWRVDVVYLTNADWKYEGSSAESGRGRTHTFGVPNPS